MVKARGGRTPAAACALLLLLIAAALPPPARAGPLFPFLAPWKALESLASGISSIGAASQLAGGGAVLEAGRGTANTGTQTDVLPPRAPRPAVPKPAPAPPRGAAPPGAPLPRLSELQQLLASAHDGDGLALRELSDLLLLLQEANAAAGGGGGGGEPAAGGGGGGAAAAKAPAAAAAAVGAAKAGVLPPAAAAARTPPAAAAAAAPPLVAAPAPAAFAYQPHTVTPELLAALTAPRAPAPAAAAAAAAAPALPPPAVGGLSWLLQRVRISGESLLGLRMDADLERLMHDSIKTSVAGASDVDSSRVEVVAAANVSVPLAFRGVDWAAPGGRAEGALRGCMAALGGGFDESHIHVGRGGGGGAPRARRMLAQAAEEWVTVTFGDMSISNATYLLDALDSACGGGGGGGGLAAGRPLRCAAVLGAALGAAGAVPDPSAYESRLVGKPTASITLTLGLGLTAADVRGGAEAKAAAWLARGELAAFAKSLNLTATPLQGLAGLLPALGALPAGGGGGGPVTLTIGAPRAPPAAGAGAPAVGAGAPGGGGGGGAAKAGYIAGISVACAIGLAALVGVGYVLAARRRDRRVGADSGGGRGGGDDDKGEAADGLGSLGGEAGRPRRGRHGARPRVYNQQKDLVGQLAQARALQAQPREEEGGEGGAQGEAERRRATSAGFEGGGRGGSGGGGQWRRGAPPRRAQSAGGAGAGRARPRAALQPHHRPRSSGAGGGGHRLERGDSVMSAVRFELDDLAAGASGSGSGRGSGIGSEGAGGAGPSTSRAPPAAAAAARRDLPPVVSAASFVAAQRRAASLPLARGCGSDEPEDDGCVLQTRRGGGQGGGPAAVAAGSGGSGAGTAAAASSHTAAAAAAAAGSAAGGSGPPTPLADVTIRSPPGSAGASLGGAKPGPGGFRWEHLEAAAADAEGEEGGEPEGPLPERPVTGRLPTPFASFGSAPGEEW
ncbi:MAG: hypothetical protein J3K34DRAFT_502838 [Monoraphidium minutum]|nr:MAG: hypothetical protein J3K34DRAFT_502838 [Monoraphidium minutum]